jgi:tRNA threonylcarbamoyladenosine biosynthesis protein TsaE
LIDLNSHPPIVKRLALSDEDGTRSFAHLLSQSPALANAFIELHGNLGAGKTTLVRHLLQSLGVKGRIKSPTYAVVESYDVDQMPPNTFKVWHFDFYRFNDPLEWEEAGFRDIFSNSGLKLAEWPERVSAQLPFADLILRLDMEEDETRTLTITAQTPTGQSLMKEIDP